MSAIIHIFKTEIDCNCKLEKLKSHIISIPEIISFTLDMEDCDKVMCIKSELSEEKLIKLFEYKNIKITALQD